MRIQTVEKNYNPISNTFSNYKVTETNGTIKFVPLAEANTDYQEIQEWAKIEGNNIIDNPPE
jgi:hypothetical protein